MFCGFGEPAYRLEDICWVIDRMKERGTKIRTRMNTNGTANLIHGRDTCPDFAGRFDEVSISLNTDTAEKYEALCRPRYPGAYEAMKDFARRWWTTSRRRRLKAAAKSARRRSARSTGCGSISPTERRT